MRYSSIDPQLFIRNRGKLREYLPEGALAVFNSNDILPTNADGTLPFRQNNDLFYLSGIDQEETILVIFPGASREDFREVLFVKKTSEEIRIWEGDKYTREQAREVSGIKTVHWLDDFEKVFRSLMMEADQVWLNSNEHLRADNVVETRDDRFRKWCREQFPLHDYRRVAPAMHELRSVKDEVEVELMRQACKITGKGFGRILRFIRPGVMEYEVEAELMHEFLLNRSRGFPYEPIVASGANACVLHYTENNAECRDGELMLMDFGAEYANYASDMTRCVPVNGRFTKRQKEVYNAVLRVQREAMKMLRPGTDLREYQEEVGKLVEKELIGLGLLDAQEVARQDPGAPLYKQFFMHGTSHHIGLDVHDVGQPHHPIRAGMVFTVEPGIYIREEGLGVRLESDVVVTDGDPVDLMKDIPIETEAIEEEMNAS